MNNTLFGLVFLLVLLGTAKPQIFGGGQSDLEESFELLGSGATLPFPVYQQWITVYHFLKPNINITYSPSGSTAGQNDIANYATTKINFAGSDSKLPDTTNSKLIQFPILAAAVVPIYNLPNLTTSIVFSRNTLSAVFAGLITTWDDPQILIDNPEATSYLTGLDPVNKVIKLIVRSDGSGTTQIFTSALQEFDSNVWTFGDSTQFPATSVNIYKSRGNSGVFYKVEDTPFSIGYVVLSVTQGDRNPTARILGIRQDSGGVPTVFYPEPQLFLDAQSSSTFSFSNGGDIYYSTPIFSYNGWPILGYTTLIFAKNINEECTKRRELFKFFNWMLNDKEAGELARSLGYSPLASDIRDTVMGMLTKVTCEDDFLLDWSYVPQHTQKSYDALPIFGGIIFFVTLVLSLFLCRRKKAGVVAFTLAILLGSAISLISVVFWALIPENSVICTMRVWFTNVGLTICYCSIFGCTWKLMRDRHFQTIAKTSKDPIQRSLTARIAKYSHVVLLCFVILEIAFLGIWQGSDPYTSADFDISSLDLTRARVCKTNHPTTWIGIQIAIFCVQFLFGLLVAWDLSTVKKAIIEIRFIRFMIINSCLAIMVVISLVYTTDSNDTDETVFIMLGILFAVITAIFCFMFPKLYKRVKITKYLMKKSQGIEMTTKIHPQNNVFSLTASTSTQRDRSDDER